MVVVVLVVEMPRYRSQGERSLPCVTGFPSGRRGETRLWIVSLDTPPDSRDQTILGCLQKRPISVLWCRQLFYVVASLRGVVLESNSDRCVSPRCVVCHHGVVCVTTACCVSPRRVVRQVNGSAAVLCSSSPAPVFIFQGFFIFHNFIAMPSRLPLSPNFN